MYYGCLFKPFVDIYPIEMEFVEDNEREREREQGANNSKST